MTNAIEQVEVQETEQAELAAEQAEAEAQTEALSDAEILAEVEVDTALADAEAAIAQHEEEVQVTEKPKRAKKEKAEKAPKAPKEPKTPKAASTKTFTVAGLSVHKGELKLRFANDLNARIKVLDKNGHEEIRLVEFEAGTKQELAQQLAVHADFQDAAAQEVIQASLAE